MSISGDVDWLLHRASELSAQLPPDAPRVDMSAESVDLRLRQASELSSACLELGRIGAKLDRVPADR